MLSLLLFFFSELSARMLDVDAMAAPMAAPAAAAASALFFSFNRLRSFRFSSVSTGTGIASDR